jgi:hypothetical protein
MHWLAEAVDVAFGAKVAVFFSVSFVWRVILHQGSVKVQEEGAVT